MQFVGISNMEFDMISYNGQNVIRFVSSISVGGFLWFTFFAPETLNAAQKANYCLFGFLAATALYYYIKYTNEIRLQDSDNIHRQTWLSFWRSPLGTRRSFEMRETRLWNGVMEFSFQ